ncbi:hypothetical protein PF003_g16331 [Phytophthora fragariae]|nr:hypothetical protein PF003_g16331 [Phytophthora fragariae]
MALQRRSPPSHWAQSWKPNFGTTTGMMTRRHWSHPSRPNRAPTSIGTPKGMGLPTPMNASNSPTSNGPSQPSRQNAPTTPRANATASVVETEEESAPRNASGIRRAAGADAWAAAGCYCQMTPTQRAPRPRSPGVRQRPRCPKRPCPPPWTSVDCAVVDKR